MSGEQTPHHSLCIPGKAARFLVACKLQELAEGTGRIPAQRSHALGHLIDELIDLFVLGLEELVQVMEARPDHVPVVVPGLRVEQILICQQYIEKFCHTLARLVGQPDLGLRHHRSSPSSLLRSSGFWTSSCVVNGPYSPHKDLSHA